MRYVKDNRVWTMTDIRLAHPEISWPREGADPQPLGYVPLVESPAPDPLPWHRVVEGAPNGVNQTWVQVPMGEDEIVSICVSAMEDLYDITAQSRRYDNRITCALRAGYTGPFQAEGQAFAVWMDTCNATAYQWWAEIEAGTKPMFASTDEFINALPVMVWPAS